MPPESPEMVRVRGEYAEWIRRARLAEDRAIVQAFQGGIWRIGEISTVTLPFPKRVDIPIMPRMSFKIYAILRN